MANDPKNFKIPSEFTLFGHRYTVEIQEDLFEKTNCYGTADDDLKKIVLQKRKMVERTSDVNGVKETVMCDVNDHVYVETFYHELMHIIFDALGKSKLSQNEALVNMLGKAMLEVYLSSTYEEEAKK